MSDATSTTQPGIAHMPPEGEHFWFEDDGEQLQLKLTPRRRYLAPMFFAFGMAFFGVPATYLLRAPGLVPTPILVVAVLFGGVLVYSFIASLLELSMGHESLTIARDRVRLQLRVVLAWRRLELPRGECRNLRVLPVEGESTEASMAYLTNSRTHGRIGFDTDRKTIRLGSQLLDEEAEKIVSFLLQRCPDLGPRGGDADG